MSYEVLLTLDAERDLEETYLYIAEYDSPQKADYVLEKIEDACAALRSAPDRGGFPKVLSSLGIREYRQIFFKPYRTIYRIHKQTVVVYLIADGRRDFQTLLSRRLLSQS